MKTIWIVALMVGSLNGTAQKKAAKHGWIQLFNEKDLRNWAIKIKRHPLNGNFGIHSVFRMENYQ